MTYTIIDAWKEAVARRGLLWPPTRANIVVGRDLWPEYEAALLEAHAFLSDTLARLATDSTGGSDA